MDKAETELNNLVLRNGAMGRIIEKKQQLIVLGRDVAAELNHVEKTIAMQLKMPSDRHAEHVANHWKDTVPLAWCSCREACCCGCAVC